MLTLTHVSCSIFQFSSTATSLLRVEIKKQPLYASMSPPSMIESPQITKTNLRSSERSRDQMESGTPTKERGRGWTKSVVAQCAASIRHPILWSPKPETRKPKKTEYEVGYLSLPGELRNRIMSLILLPGKIYLPASRYALLDRGVLPPPVDIFGDFIHDLAFFGHSYRGLSSVSEDHVRTHRCFLTFATCDELHYACLAPKANQAMLAPPEPLPAFQLLVASQQIHDEGHVMFWSQNSFYLPRGPLPHTQFYFGNVLPQHKALISSIGIQFSLLDLTDEVLAAVDGLLCCCPQEGWGIEEQYGIRRFQAASVCTVALAWIWTSKLAWIRGWKGLKELRLDILQNPPNILDGEQLDILLAGIGSKRTEHPYNSRCSYWPSELHWPFADATRGLDLKLGTIIEEIGWLRFKRWLKGEEVYERPWNNREDAE